MTNPETYDKLRKSSGNGHEKNMGVFPSGQWGQTVNLLLFSFGGSNPPAPTKEKHLGMKVLGCFLFVITHYETHFLTYKHKMVEKMRCSMEKLRQIAEELRIINQNIENIQVHGQNNCTAEIAQLCADLQHLTEEMRSILTSKE